MSTHRTCPDCGQPLAEDVLDGVCAICSLRGALQARPDAAVRQNQRPGTGIQQPAKSLPPAAGLNSQAFVRDFGDYELLEEIARGGMGIVYKARQKKLDRIVALKMLLFGPHASAEFANRFRAEAVLAASLQHPNIVAIHEVGVHQGQQFFVMDCVEGQSLASLAGHQPLPAIRAAGYLRTIAEAIHYAHGRGILHRDLKPSNVLIDANDQPRITDFGLAKRFSPDSSLAADHSSLTLTGQVLGSPNFIPPEQAQGKHGHVSRQSDVYALGAMLYHLLTGRPPFQGESITDTLQQVLNSEPLPPRLLNPGVPRDVETVCLKCLEKQAARRYPTARALAEDLDRFLRNEPVRARPVSAIGKAWKWCRRRPALTGVCAALATTLVAGLTLASWQWQRTRASELLGRYNAYAADMNLAQAAVENGAAMTLLDAHRPQPRQKDLRGWEWRYLWQGCRKDDLFELTRSTNGNDRVAFSPDGRWLAVRDEKAVLSLWDLDARQRIFSFQLHGYLHPFALSQQRNLLAYIAKDWVVMVVSLDTRLEIARLPQSTNVAHLAFSADAARLCTVAEEGTLAEWIIASGERFRTSRVPRTDIEQDLDSLVFSPDGRVTAFASANGIDLWEFDSGKRAHLRLTAAAGAPTVLSFSPDGKLLAAGMGGADSEVWVWAVEDLWRAVEEAPLPRVRFGKHRDWISGLAFSPDNRALVSASADSALRVWEFAHPESSRRYQGHRHQVLSVAWSPDGKRVVSGGKDGSVRVWDPWREPDAFGFHELPAAASLYGFHNSSDGKRAMTVDGTNGTVMVWDTVNLRLAEILGFAGSNNTVAAWSPDGKTLATGDARGNVRLWELASGREITNAIIPGWLIGHLHFSYDGRFLACGAMRQEVRAGRFWQLNPWREIHLPPAALDNLLWQDLSTDSGLLVVLHRGGALDMWDIHSGHCRTRLSQPMASPNELGMVWFSPNGQSWASFTQRGVLCLWEGLGKHPPVIIPRSAQELWHLAYSADGTRLLLSGKRASDAVRLLDLNSQRFVATLSGKPDVYWNIRMSRDNSSIFAVGKQRILIWRAPSWAEIEAAEEFEGKEVHK